MENNQHTLKKKASFTCSLGFVLAAAGSAVGLGNIWRFPYLAANGGGGLFILVYIILALTVGFALLTTDIVIGRKTGKNALHAFADVAKKWKFLGILTFVVPSLILTYYTVVGGWVLKYLFEYIRFNGATLANDVITGAGETSSYFINFLTKSDYAPIVFLLIFFGATALIVFGGVEKGIEKFSRFIMPGLLVLIVIIAAFVITRSYTDPETGVKRTGLEGMAIYLIPSFKGVSVSKFLQIVLDAVCQLFYSLSVSMGIMVTYGSYVEKDVNINKSVMQIEIFDTGVAILAGLMVIPAVYVFQGLGGMTQGAGLMFISLPKVFQSMGTIGNIVGILFFVMVLFAALTSSVSIMEAVVAGFMETFKKSRKLISVVVFIVFAALSVLVCLGYNEDVWLFNVTLPNGKSGQQLLDVIDYISNNLLMPIVSFLTCILIGWVVKPKWIKEEILIGSDKFGRERLYNVIIRYIAPALMVIIFATAIGLDRIIIGLFK